MTAETLQNPRNVGRLMNGTRSDINPCNCGCGQDAGVYARTERGHVAGEPRAYCTGHNSKTPHLPPFQRFMQFVDKRGEEECWTWVGALDGNGYGRFWVDGRLVPAHRWLCEQMRGHLPRDLQVDHLCFNPPCVNPSHLEPVPQGVNVQRSYNRRGSMEHCLNGHARTPENVRLDAEGHIVCRECVRVRGSAKVSCPDCGSRVGRSNLQRHRRESCIEREAGESE